MHARGKVILLVDICGVHMHSKPGNRVAHAEQSQTSFVQLQFLYCRTSSIREYSWWACWKLYFIIVL